MHSIIAGIANSFTDNLIAEQRYRMILDGLQVTLLITFCAAVLGTLLGGVVCWARMSRKPWLRQTAKIYIDLMRGTPVLVLLMLMYYVFMAPLGTTGITVAVVTFAMNASAYIGEMLRSSIESIDRGQREAGLALGHTPRQTFFRIILPQVVKAVQPVYQGEVISLLKGTSIVGYIAVMDMTRASDLIRSRTFDAFFPLLVTAAIYFLVAWLIGLVLTGLVQRRTKRVAVATSLLIVLSVAGAIPSIAESQRSKVESQTAAAAPPVFRALEGKRVGVIIGSIQDIAVTQYAPKADIRRYTSMTDIMAALENGKVDVLCQENFTVTANKAIAAVVDTVDAGLPPRYVAACFKLGNTALQQDFNAFLADIRADGTYQKIFDRWLKTDDPAALPAPHQYGTGELIRVATYPAMPPDNFICSGQPSGMEIDLLTEWANRRNYRLEFLMMDFASQIPALQTGKADIALGSVAVTEERQKQVLFSDGYNAARIMFYTRKGEADMAHMDKCATCFLLSPGAVQIFYGDEVGRKTSDAILNVDAAQGFRSDYDWSAPNDTLMAHYRKLCAFRKDHSAVGAGKQTMLNSTTVIRSLDEDTIVIALNPQTAKAIPVPFADGEHVRNAYSGETSIVQNGRVLLQQSSGHVALIEKTNE